MPQSLSSWLMGNRWDQRERAKRYKDHVIGEGWQEPFRAVSDDAKEANPKPFQHVPGFKREKAPSMIDPTEVTNSEWPVDFDPVNDKVPKSWRSRLNKYVNKHTMISNIKANPKKGLMLVTFGSNGAMVTYDHVPREVIAHLQYIAKSGESLGKAFWDIVRYRGQAGGSKYPWYVAKEGSSAASDRAAANEGISPEEKKQWDKVIYEELKVFDTPSWRTNYSVEEADKVQKFVDRLTDAYDAEDYTLIKQLYVTGVKQGYLG